MPDVFNSEREKTADSESAVEFTDHAESSRTNSTLNSLADVSVETSKNANLPLESDTDVANKSSDKLVDRIKLPRNSNGPLSAFCYFPERVNFSNKDPEEKVVLLLRRHPITNLKWLIGTFFLVVLPAFLSAMPVFETMPANFRTLFFLIWYLFTSVFVYEKFLSWFFNVFIVTDERVFDVDFYNLTYRKITDANIDQIQDVTVQIGGGIRTLFNYGDVLIQTAAEIPEIQFEAVPTPDRVAKILRGLRVEEEVEKLEGRIR